MILQLLPWQLQPHFLVRVTCARYLYINGTKATTATVTFKTSVLTVHNLSQWIVKFGTKLAVSYPADVVLTLCGDGLKDHFLTADAEENFLNFVQEFLQKQQHEMCEVT